MAQRCSFIPRCLWEKKRGGVRRLRKGGEEGGKMGRGEGGMAEEKANLVMRLKETLLSHSIAKHDTYSIPCDEIPHIM